METDLIFHHGVDLPCFAAFPLLETPTWRANPDWGAAPATTEPACTGRTPTR